MQPLLQARKRHSLALPTSLPLCCAAVLLVALCLHWSTGYSTTLFLTSKLPVPLTSAAVPLKVTPPFDSEESHVEFCERNGCAKFPRFPRHGSVGEAGPEDKRVFWEDSTHDQLSEPFKDVKPLREFQCKQNGISVAASETRDDSIPTLKFADSETAAQGLARALGYSSLTHGESVGDTALGTALQQGLVALREEWEAAAAANLCKETDPVVRQSSCWTQTAANAGRGGDPFVRGCDQLGPHCIAKKGYGSYDDLDNLKYVLDCAALDVECMPGNVLHEIHEGSYHGGSSLGKGHVNSAGHLVHENEDGSEVEYGTKRNDYDFGNKGRRLQDFVGLNQSRIAHLNEVHVAALRLYTTSSFRLFNQALRDRAMPHPIKFTVWQLSEALRRLRAYSAHLSQDEFLAMSSTWRGFKDLVPPSCFCDIGGTELGVMSTTPNLAVALGLLLWRCSQHDDACSHMSVCTRVACV